MKIIKTNPINPASKDLTKASEVLKRGGIVMYPTDTCYGLGADISNRFAFDKIYKIKKRTRKKPVSVIVKDFKEINNIAIVEEWHIKYIDKYMPGPVTFIFLTLDQDIFPFSSIGIRIPNYKFTQELSKHFKYPYVTTSANVSGYPPTYSVKDFLAQLSSDDLRPDIILDAGTLPKNQPSTVVDMTNNHPKVLRQGSVNIKEI